MRGRKPKSLKLHVLQGTRKRADAGESRPQTADPTCPSWMPADAKRVWRRLAPAMARAGLLTELDVDMFSIYCVTLSQWRNLHRRIEKLGEVYLAANGLVRKRPEVVILQDYTQRARLLAEQFGLTPLARTRIGVTPPPSEPDAFDEFMARKP